jgi:biofilm PGA synthesis lipoprotein PgaB
MPRRLLATALALLAMLAGCTPTRPDAPAIVERSPKPQQVLVLCYHDLADSGADQSYVAVTSAKLVQQLSWLKRNGWTAVSVDDILAARDGRRKLPEKAVLLTFDDGYASFYTRVFPLLKEFRYPAVLALVGSWMAGKPGETVGYGDAALPRERFMTWDEVREVAASGLVEIAAHSGQSHLGIPANPQGNREPAIVTRRYDAADGSYEREAAYRDRLRQDAEGISATIRRETGRAPRAMVWPYGEHSGLAISIFGAAGMPITMTLIDGPADPRALDEMPRHLVAADPDLATFVADLRDQAVAAPGPVRVVHVDLDYVYDPDPAQQARNLDRLIERIRDYQISTVYLQAFADPAGSGLVREVYFPNRQLPVRADLFNRVAWQLRTRAQVEVFAWLPVLAFDLPGAKVLAWNKDTGAAAPDPAAYRRLSPFDAAARGRILSLYEDLARNAPVSGLLFHDDAFLSDFEDASAPALDAYARAGLPRSIAAIRGDPELFRRWTSLKTETLIAFTQELAARVRLYRSPLKTARNIFARPLLEPESEAWFAQNYDRFLAAYDQTAVMAMPYMENVPAGEADAWLRRLVERASRRPGGLARTVFELQAVDWRVAGDAAARRIPTETLAGQMRLLARFGARNYGYYPDDFIGGHPDAAALHRALSLQSHPYRPR